MNPKDREKLERIADGVSRIDERTLNLEKHILSVSGKTDNVRRELNDHKESTDAHGLKAAKGAVRKVVEHLETDRPLFNDHNAMAEAVKRCDVLEAVEKAIGGLKGSW